MLQVIRMKNFVLDGWRQEHFILSLVVIVKGGLDLRWLIVSMLLLNLHVHLETCVNLPCQQESIFVCFADRSYFTHFGRIACDKIFILCMCNFIVYITQYSMQNKAHPKYLCNVYQRIFKADVYIVYISSCIFSFSYCLLHS